MKMALFILVFFPFNVNESYLGFIFINYLIHNILGKDYRQPAPALFKPVRKIAVQKKNSKFEDEDDEMIIEHDSGSVSSPKSPKHGENSQSLHTYEHL